MKKFWQSSDVQKRFSIRRWLRLNLLLLFLTGLVSVSFPVISLSRKLGDFYFRLRGDQPTSRNVALVLIDDSALGHYGRWPWPRKQLAQLIGAVSQFHPKAIGIDILLTEPEDEANDSTLESAIAQAHNVVLPAKLSGSPLRSMWINPLPRFSRAAAAVGHVQAVVDSDGLCREIPIAEPSAEGLHPAFAVAVVNVANPGAVTPAGIASLSSPEQMTGIDRFEPKYLTINYRQQFSPGESVPPFVTLSANDLLSGQKEEILQDKIILIGFGATELTAELSDRLFTPVSNQSPMPGVEVNANAVATILEGKQILSLGTGPQMFLILGVSMLSLWIVMWWPGGRGLLYLSLLLLAECAAGYFLLAIYHRQLLYGPFLVAGVLAAPLAQLENLVVIDRAITRRLKELQQFLPLSAQSSPHKVLIPLENRSPSHLHWKLKSLQQLQDELASLYTFDETLLETMQEALAVYSLEGKLLFHNSSWERFCIQQALPDASSLQDFMKALGLEGGISQVPTQSGTWLEKELSLKEGLWRFRSIQLAWPSHDKSNAIMLLLEDISARRQRDQARAEALGFVTHELRTPLMAIQGFAELLMNYPETPATSDAPATIFRESRRLVAMVNAYLEVLRMDVGSRPLRLHPVKIQGIVRHVHQILQPLAQAAHIEVLVETGSERQVVYCDEPLVTGALLNLVSNALKYSPRGSTVKLQTSVKENEVEFLVSNPGPAIPPNELDRIFEPYYQVSQQSDSRAGWGLGLAFVKRISEQHGGRIEVSSDPASGTCFRFILPIHSQVASEVAI